MDKWIEIPGLESVKNGTVIQFESSDAWYIVKDGHVRELSSLELLRLDLMEFIRMMKRRNSVMNKWIEFPGLESVTNGTVIQFESSDARYIVKDGHVRELSSLELLRLDLELLRLDLMEFIRKIMQYITN